MSTPFMAETRIVSFNFAPKGWAQCNGQLLPINQNQALFSLLGTTFGGDGRVNFALPDLRGRAAISFGNGFTLGEKGGQEAHTVTISEMPAHFHQLNASNVGSGTPTLNGNMLAQAPGGIYTAAANFMAINAATVSSVGGSQPHENRQPSLTLNIIIALQGIFPSQT